jgi:hypothetical protein
MIEQFTITRHAQARILDMGVEPFVIRECLLRPERIRPQNAYPGRKCFDYGDITCVLDGTDVITVLWRTPELWEKDIAERGEYNGRSLRQV